MRVREPRRVQESHTAAEFLGSGVAEARILGDAAAGLCLCLSVGEAACRQQGPSTCEWADPQRSTSSSLGSFTYGA